MLDLIKRAIRDFLDDDCPTMAAALAYYTVFALPAVLFLLLTVVGVLMDPRLVQEKLVDQFGGMLGAKGGAEIEVMVRSASERASGSGIKVVVSILMLVFGASGAFMQLQKALNRAWEVAPDPKQGGVKSFLTKRVLSLGLLLTVAFLMIVSLVVSALLTAFGDYLGGLLGGMPDVALHILQLIVSVAVLTVLFAIIFRYLPDAEVSWSDTRLGAIVTALLFTLGKFLIGFYLGRSDPGSAFGAAGALAVILVWVYYSAMIVLLGAEFTQAWAVTRGESIRPESGAIRTSKR